MRYLLRWASLRHLLGEKRNGLTLLGVALGVAVFIAIRIANVSVLDAYRRSIDTVAGKTTLEIAAPVGALDETVLPEVRTIPGVLSSAPVVQTVLPIVSPSSAEGEVLWMVGVDLLEERGFREYDPIGPEGGAGGDLKIFESLLDPDALLLTEKFAARHRLAPGDPLSVRMGDRILPFHVRGLLRAKGAAEAQDGNIAILDIASAQWRFEKIGKLDRIDLITDDRVPIEEMATRISARLGGAAIARPGAERLIDRPEAERSIARPGAERLIVRRPEQRGAQVEKMLAAFQLNLTALSAISLFVGVFLIYNTLLVSVAHRRKEIGVLRAVGARRRDIFRLFTIEGVMIGAAGGLLGVLTGALLARSVLRLIARTVRSLYVSIPSSSVGRSASGLSIALSPRVFLEGVGIGVAVAAFSSFFPALQAGLLKPREAMEGIYSQQRRLNHWRFLAAGIGFGLISFLLSRLPPAWNLPIAGYAAAASLLIAFSLLVPSATILFARSIRPILVGLPPSYRLAQGRLEQAIHRNGPTIAAFMGALAMMISVVIMIESFRETVTLWIDQTIKADLIVAPASLLSRERGGTPDVSDETAPERLLSEIAAAPGVAAVDGYRSMRIAFRGEPAVLVGRDLAVHALHSRYLFKSGRAEAVIPRAIRKKQILVSEVFANRFHLREGDAVEIPSPRGPVRFEIGGVFYEYATDGGKIVLDRVLLKEIWSDDRINVVGVYLQSGASLDGARRRIVETAGSRYGLIVVAQAPFKKEIMKIFDQTFLITYALEWIAIVVAVIGIANTLFVSVLERRREIGILRAIGASREQVTRIVLIEALYMGLIGYFLSLLCALFLSLLLIFVINEQSFGWTLLFHFPPAVLLHALLLAIGASWAAGYFPARRAAGVEVTEAIAYE